MFILEVEGLDVWYGQIQVLKNVTLRVDENELVALLGLNGHGKSTLLKTICGLVSHKKGTIKFKGTEIGHMSTQRIAGLGLVYIPEEGYLFSNMTVLENLKMGAYLPDAWKVRNRTLSYIYDIFPRLKEREKQVVNTLSGGERRMLAIARGLMSGANFLAIDEPSLGLAPKLRLEVFKKIKTINEEKKEILLVEENITESLKLCNRAYILEDGAIVNEGTAQDLLSNNGFRKSFFLDNAN